VVVDINQNRPPVWSILVLRTTPVSTHSSLPRLGTKISRPLLEEEDVIVFPATR